MATIYDIAKKVGVSSSTVSRALAGSQLVTEKVRAEVEKIAEEIGYHRRTVKRPRDRAILNVRLVLPRPRQRERSLFYDIADLAEGLAEGFGGITIRIGLDLASAHYEPFPHKKGGDTDAFVFAFHRPAKRTVKEVSEAGVPFVVLNRWIRNTPCLATDHIAGYTALLTHLLDRRADLRPVFLGFEGLGQILEERRDAFLSVSKELGIPADASSVHIFSSPESVDTATIRDLVRSGANALCAINDILGIIALEELRGLRAEVPKRVAVTGFDASPLRMLTRPLLTTSSMPVRELATEAGRRLAAEVIDKEKPEPSKRLPGRLFVGDTT